MTGFTGRFSMPRATMGEMTGCGSGSTSGTANTGLGGSGTTFGAVRSASTTVFATGLAGAAVGSGVISSSLMMGLTVATGGFVGLAGAAVAETFGTVGSTTGLAIGFGMAAEAGFGVAFGGRTGGIAGTVPKFGMSGTDARFGCSGPAGSGATRNVTGLSSGMSVIAPPPGFRRMTGRSSFRPRSAVSGWWTTGPRRSRTASRPTASAPRSRACRPCRPSICSSSS